MYFDRNISENQDGKNFEGNKWVLSKERWISQQVAKAHTAHVHWSKRDKNLYLVCDINISFSSSDTQFYESWIFCLFTFRVFLLGKSFKLILQYTQKCQYNPLH